MMKKLFYLVMMCASILCGCGNGNDDVEDPNNPDNVENPNESNKPGSKEGVITMVPQTNKIEDWVIRSFKEGDLITFDWGDGTKEEFKTVADHNLFEYYYCKVEHAYSNSNPYRITIKGNIKTLFCSSSKLISLDVSKCTALTGLSCYSNNLSALDVSKNTELTYLTCDYNSLTSLDMSKNTELTYLTCDHNNLTSLDVSKNTALTKLYCGGNNLSATVLNKIFNDLPKHAHEVQAEIRIGNNPGSETCNRSIAYGKGWDVINN